MLNRFIAEHDLAFSVAN